MSVAYRAVGWNAEKRRYDLVLAGVVIAMLVVLVGGGALVQPHATIETLLIRACAVTTFVLLHVVLAIGPLCRLDRRFLPLLYNRRHLGVTVFLLALAHGAIATVQFHALGNLNPIISLLTTSTGSASVTTFPFQAAGLLALVVLFVMAATSHDFWLRTLTPRVWKSIHMSVYIAYALVVTHVAFGALQFERSPWLALTLAAGVTGLLGLHVAAARREHRRDEEAPRAERLADVCAVGDIAEGRAVVATIGGERVAVFRHGGRLSAISNVCQHQNGPLGEGRIVNGCVVCPWHGYEYDPESGASPPPFTEKVSTFSVCVRGGRVLVDPTPHEPGTRIEPARIA